MRAVSYNTEHLFHTIFPPHLYSHWLTSHMKAYTMNINHIQEEFLSFLKAGSRHIHVVLFFKQCDEYFMSYETQQLPWKRHQRKAEALALPFPLLWFTFHSSKLTFAHVRSRTDCGHTYPQEICDLYGNNSYCVTHICPVLFERAEGKGFHQHIHVLLICFVQGKAKACGG